MDNADADWGRCFWAKGQPAAQQRERYNKSGQTGMVGGHKLAKVVVGVDYASFVDLL